MLSMIRQHAWTGLVAAGTLVAALGEGLFEPLGYAAAALLVWGAIAICVIGRIFDLARIGKLAVYGGLILAAIAGLTLLSTAWASDQGRAFQEGVLAALYVGLFVLAACTAGERARRHWIAGLATGVAIAGFISLFAYLHPGVLDSGRSPIANAAGRLSYPIGYWNGAASLFAVGGVLLGVLRGERGHQADAQSGGGGDSRAGLGDLADRLPGSAGRHRHRLRPPPDRSEVPGAARQAPAPGGPHGGGAGPDQRSVARPHDWLAGGGKALRRRMDDPLGRSRDGDHGRDRLGGGWLASARPGLPPTSLATLAALVIGTAIAIVAIDPVEKIGDFTAAPSKHARPRVGVNSNGRWQFWRSAGDAFASSPEHGVGAGSCPGGVLGPAFDASSVCAQSAFAAHAECRRARLTRHRRGAGFTAVLVVQPGGGFERGDGGEAPALVSARGSRSGRRHRLDLAAPGGDLARARLRRAAGRHGGASAPRETGPVGVADRRVCLARARGERAGSHRRHRAEAKPRCSGRGPNGRGDRAGPGRRYV